MSTESVIILDFGSQYTQLIARKVRELHTFSQILPYSADPADVLSLKPKGIVLSGGPASVLDSGSPQLSPEILRSGIPILGICYGMQLVSLLLGGTVVKGETREYGRALLQIDQEGTILSTVADNKTVWMSHGDVIAELPPGFIRLAHTDDCDYAVAESSELPIALLQFHPEVAHTEQGAIILRNFVQNMCRCEANWSLEDYAQTAIEDVRQRVGKERVLCGISGGVDSSVTAALVHKAVGDQLQCVLVDHGMMRQNECEDAQRFLTAGLSIDITVVDARERFLKKLRGVVDPESKRRIIGEEFIAVFEAQKEKLGSFSFLAQGTLYPDVIESHSVKGPSATIKSHHNVGGLPERMNLKLIEPLRELFKDEVRELAEVLKLPEELYRRHPFPGPGLAVRILGEVNEESLSILRQADRIFLEALRNEGLYDEVWQAFAVLLPTRSVGVMGDQRTYEQVIAIRAVTSTDGMTADWARLPLDFLARVSSRIVNGVHGVNRVVYDISSKPPSTIEWE
jgi:GMP synthase (glutamine-hydrolysing)